MKSIGALALLALTSVASAQVTCDVYGGGNKVGVATFSWKKIKGGRIQELVELKINIGALAVISKSISMSTNTGMPISRRQSRDENGTVVDDMEARFDG